MISSDFDHADRLGLVGGKRSIAPADAAQATCAAPERSEVAEAGTEVDRTGVETYDTGSLRDLALQAGRQLAAQPLSIANHDSQFILKLLGG